MSGPQPSNDMGLFLSQFKLVLADWLNRKKSQSIIGLGFKNKDEALQQIHQLRIGYDTQRNNIFLYEPSDALIKLFNKSKSMAWQAAGESHYVLPLQTTVSLIFRVQSFTKQIRISGALLPAEVKHLWPVSSATASPNPCPQVTREVQSASASLASSPVRSYMRRVRANSNASHSSASTASMRSGSSAVEQAARDWYYTINSALNSVIKGVHDPARDTLGKGFFCSKAPANIVKLRELFRDFSQGVQDNQFDGKATFFYGTSKALAEKAIEILSTATQTSSPFRRQETAELYQKWLSNLNNALKDKPEGADKLIESYVKTRAVR